MMKVTKLNYTFFQHGHERAIKWRAHSADEAISAIGINFTCVPLGAKAAVILWRDHFGKPNSVTIYSDGTRVEGLVKVRWGP
jgi:hypothetical protein